MFLVTEDIEKKANKLIFLFSEVLNADNKTGYFSVNQAMCFFVRKLEEDEYDIFINLFVSIGFDIHFFHFLLSVIGNGKNTGKEINTEKILKAKEIYSNLKITK